YYDRALRAAASDPERLSASASLLSDAERAFLTETWNATWVAHAKEAPVHRLFEASVDRLPDAVAVVAGSRAVTYADLERMANRLAHRLIGHGVGPTGKALVGIAMERSIELVATMLAVLKAGAAYVPLDPDYPPSRLAFMI